MFAACDIATWWWVFRVNFRIFFGALSLLLLLGVVIESLIKLIICLLEDDAADDEVGAKLNIWWWWWWEWDVSLLFDKLTVFIWVWLASDEINVAGIGNEESEISLDPDASWWLFNSL